MSIKTKLLLTYAVSLVTLIAVCALYQQSIGRLLEARRWVEHTHIVLERLESIISLCKDMETGQRGFALTGQEIFLEPYNRALSKLSPTIAQVRALTSDNPVQQRRLDRLEDLEAANVAFAQRIVELSRNKGTTAAADLTATQQGKKLMDSLRAVVAEMDNDERALLLKRTQTADDLLGLTSVVTMFGAVIASLVVSIVKFATITSFSKSVGNLQDGLNKIAEGDLASRIKTDSNDEFSKLGAAFNGMADKLKRSIEENTDHAWLIGGLARLSQLLQGDRDLQSAAQKTLVEFASTVGSKHGLLYVSDRSTPSAELVLLANYGHHEKNNLAKNFAVGQSLVGQCAMDHRMIVVENAPDDYIRISSGLGEAKPVSIAVVPVIFENQLKAVIEQASFQPFSSIQLQYLEQAATNLGVIFSSIEAAQQTEKLLRQEQTLTEELQSQQEELTENNRKLETLADSLQASEEELRQQQEELQQTNEELEERSRIQAKQNIELETKNAELEALRISMQEKAHELSLTSKYKSEFLSNMSHELRTPLNSLLILSKVLFENHDGNLTSKQVEFARTIYSAGSDLLVLIDDVLDISKIEAGAMSIDPADEPLPDLCAALVANFEPLAREKELSFSIQMHPQLPRYINTDCGRLQQVLKNIISNAIKFTDQGSVLLKIEKATGGWSIENQILNNAGDVIAFSIVDTGMGIAQDKQEIIFEAFRQADGTTQRRFGGSGLGLAISKEIVRLLGGDIQLKSAPGEGSTFTVYLPVEYSGPVELLSPTSSSSNSNSDLIPVPKQPLPLEPEPLPPAGNINDDRSNIRAGDKILLVVHQDSDFINQVTQLAHAREFKVVSASHGRAAFTLVQRFKPDAILLDVGLPDKDGWIFMDRLKRDLNTRHIPVQVISDEERAKQARRLGAFGFLSEPASQKALIEMLNEFKQFATQETRQLLIVEDNEVERNEIQSLIEGNDVQITAVKTGQEAIEALSRQRFDCMIVDLKLPDITGFELLNRIQRDQALSGMRIIVHTGKMLNSQEEIELRRYAEAIVVKGSKSNERLLDETSLFLHRVERNLPEDKRKALERLHLKDPLLCARRVLVVDDDMRHIFAITSLLEQYDMQVIYAENGKQAIETLANNPEIDLVLMDIMMPDMDGYEAVRAIRTLDQFKSLPIIALTAKAMKGDREQCIAAGASDYLSKPVDADQLLSLMRVWLY